MHKDGHLEGFVKDITYKVVKEQDGASSKVPVIHVDVEKSVLGRPFRLREDFLRDYVGVDPDGVINDAHTD